MTKKNVNYNYRLKKQCRSRQERRREERALAKQSRRNHEK